MEEVQEEENKEKIKRINYNLKTLIRNIINSGFIYTDKIKNCKSIKEKIKNIKENYYLKVENSFNDQINFR